MNVNDNFSVSKYTCLLLTFSELIYFKVLSIGYVIAGFVAKFQDHLLLYKVIQKLNTCNLGIFPLGSFINALIFAPTPAVIVNVLNSVITYLGIYKRRIHYLQIVSMIIVFYLIHCIHLSRIILLLNKGKECVPFITKDWNTAIHFTYNRIANLYKYKLGWTVYAL